MATRSDAADKITETFALDGAAAQTVARYLAADRVISCGTRGRPPVPITPADAARILVGVMGAVDPIGGSARRMSHLVLDIESTSRDAFALLVADIEGRGDGEYVVRFCGDRVGLYRVAPGEAVQDGGNGRGLIREYRATRNVIEALRSLFDNALAA